MRFLTAADIANQPLCITLARRAGSNRGTSESSKGIVTPHTRVLPERALIHIQQSLFTEKTKHQKTQPRGCHKNVLTLHQTGRQGPHCLANNSTMPPSKIPRSRKRARAEAKFPRPYYPEPRGVISNIGPKWQIDKLCGSSILKKSQTKTTREDFNGLFRVVSVPY